MFIGDVQLMIFCDVLSSRSRLEEGMEHEKHRSMNADPNLFQVEVMLLLVCVFDCEI